MSAIKKLLIIAVILAGAASNYVNVVAVTDNVTINLSVGCNANAVCEADLGENRLNCAGDCAICDRNGVCDASLGETKGNCSSDCLAAGCDNNGVCAPARGENSGNCPADCPAPKPVPGEGGKQQPGQKLAAPIISDIAASNITLSSARIVWKTDIAARCRLLFGDSADYKNGAVYETDFGKNHAANIAGLAAQTVYHFAIGCANINGAESRAEDRQFTTLSLPDAFPPANISDFQAAAEERAVKLEWKNPGDADFAGVRILRSEKFYPQDLMTGRIIYDGNGTEAIDTEIENGKTYYYTAFAYDRSGNYSSGAIASAIAGEPGREAEIPTVEAPAEIQKIDLRHFNFTQDGKTIKAENGRIAVDRFKTFKISINYDDAPEVLKTIMVTLKKEDKEFSFLLRINKDKTAYEAILAPPDEGEYNFDIMILDYKNQALKKISGSLKVDKAQLSRTNIETAEYTITTRKIPPLNYLLCILVALFAARKIILVYRRRKNRRADEMAGS